MMHESFVSNAAVRLSKRRGVASLGVVLLLASSLRSEWGGTAQGTWADTQSDTLKTSVVDQQYQFHLSGLTVPSLRYQAFMRFRRLETHTEGDPAVWRTETQPTISTAWTNPLCTARGDYTYREYRSRDDVNELVGRTVSADAQTNLQGWPRLRGRYEWTKNINNLEIYGRDTRLQRLSAGTNYVFRRLSVLYEFSERRLRNYAGLTAYTREHEARADHSFSQMQGGLTVSSGYRGVYRTESQQTPFDPSTLLPLSAVAGLYGDDSTPEFGELALAGGLVDGNLENPASLTMDLSSAAYHNFGLDFGAAAEADHLFLITDTLANPDQRFAVFGSSDNQTWSVVKSYQTYRFNAIFWRYEIDFPRQASRYLKIVAEPAPQSQPVYVNELRAYVTRDEAGGPVHSDDHRGIVDVRVHPWSWMNLGAGGSVQRAGRSQTQIAREQDGANASISVEPIRWFRVSSHYQFSRTGFPASDRSGTDNEVWSFTTETRPLSTLSAVVSAGRQKERIGDNLNRRADNTSVRINTQIFPELSSATELTYVEDHRFPSSDVLFTRSAGATFEGRPNGRSQFGGEYRIYRLHSRGRTVPQTRVSSTLRASYQMTRAVTGRGDLSRFDEGGRGSLVTEGGLSWTATPKLSLAGSINRAVFEEGASSTLVTAQALFRANQHSDASVSYAHNHFDNDVQPATSNLRFAFTVKL